ncbi:MULTISPECIES: response regulator [unclassified Algibacter]|uniref:response regulator n=1 Tax=unclassified Algibacter TaxID=2615009 RepID=UPI00131AC413|nr:MULTISPECIES: response regulator [unclassified Algibacter]MCL5127741.1 response regulator [Algibacter sp. L4_22]
MIDKLPLIGIIDDDKIYHFMLTRIIKHNKLAERVIDFYDGEKAIEYLTDNTATKENIPDIIFVDNNMPIMDGWQFIDAYTRLEPEIKKKVYIFMVSSSIDPIDIERASKINQISDYIVKPIKLEEVKAIIDNLEKF